MTRQATRRKTFLPFGNLGTAGALELRAVHADGHPVPVLQGAEGRLDLTHLAEAAEFRLDVELALPEQLGDWLLPGERIPEDIRVVVLVEDQASWYRAATPLVPMGPGRWRGTVRVARDRIDRGFELHGVVCRDRPAEVPVPGLPSERGARLLETHHTQVLLAEPAERAGGLLDVRWKRFSDEPALHAAAGEPYFLQLTADPPVLWLNAEVEGLREVVTAKGHSGARARMRELLFRTMALHCWTALFHAAAAGYRRDEAGEVQTVLGWHSQVLRVVAEQVFAQEARSVRWQRLADWLDELPKHPDHLELLLEQVSIGLSRWLQLGPAVGRALRAEDG